MRLPAALAAMSILFFPANALAARKPAFVYAAAFFYERMPRAQWAQALQAYKSLGINTIDLYVMWNWHEPRDGSFDFTGRTDPRRDLRGLLQLIHRDGFALILRPGPVIRNEWRNGGYPSWLLERPEYGMPLRDVLEGRYPATATLQNAHSDAAAEEWMRNRTHVQYAARWLHRVFQEAKPYRSDIVAVALDDDQGAYIDNETWPGPHFHEYMHRLAALVHRDLPGMPVFINTYQMKVTASAPVWAWGNWYQSDAYSIGEHDRAQIAFSTALLQTQEPARPVMVSEFQAGWLQGAGQPRPRAADPSNTELALHSFLQAGAHGVVNFPVQDTLNPAGWEAPWTNAFYGWDAALSVQLTPQGRFAPTRRFGELVARYGDALAQTHPAADAAVAYMTSAYNAAQIANAAVMQIAAATVSAQQGCVAARITCDLVDLRFDSVQRLRHYPSIVIPDAGVHLSYSPTVQQKIDAYRASGGRIVATPAAAQVRNPHAGGIPNAVLLVSNDRRFGFVDIVNYTSHAIRLKAARVHDGSFSANAGPLTVAPRSGLLVPLNVRAHAVTLPPLAAVREPARAVPLREDSWIVPGAGDIVLRGARTQLLISPCAGGRAFVFEDLRSRDNLFTTIGGLRDTWSPALAPSPRDYIAKYTHPIATGTFNRCYAASRSNGTVSLQYAAPDAPPHGARFLKGITLTPDGFSETLYSAFVNGRSERAQQLTSFALPRGTRVFRAHNGIALYDAARRRVVLAAWDSGIIAHTLEAHDEDALLTLTFEPGGPRHVWFGVADARGMSNAQAALRAFANRPPRG